MSTRNIKTALLAAGLLAGQVALAAGASGQAIGFTCNGCHGHDGRSKGSVPSIGVSASYIENAMLDFKSGKRQGTIMNRIAKGYTDQEIKAMADYFASLK